MEVKVGLKYKHFKGHIYEVIMIANDADSDNEIKKMVVYQNVDSKEVWVRRLEDFISQVDKNKYPDIKQHYRFELVLE